MRKCEDEIKVLFVRPDRKPIAIKVENELAAMQKLVGGYIEQTFCFPEDPEVVCVCCEEGKIMGMPLNRAMYDEKHNLTDIIAGDFFIALAPENSEYYHSLPDELIEKYSTRFELAEKFSIEGKGKITVFDYLTSY